MLSRSLLLQNYCKESCNPQKTFKSIGIDGFNGCYYPNLFKRFALYEVYSRVAGSSKYGKKLQETYKNYYFSTTGILHFVLRA